MLGRFLLVVDQAVWILYWIGQYLSLQLRTQYDVDVVCQKHGERSEGTITHFIDRYTYLNGLYKSYSESDIVFLNWFHGYLDDPNPHICRMFDHLNHAMPTIDRIIASCSLTQNALTQAGIPGDKIMTIPLGIDLSVFYPWSQKDKEIFRKKLGIPNRSFCVGLFQKDGCGWGEGNEPKLEKGPDVFLDTVAQLSKKYRHLFVLLTGPSRGYVKKGLERMGVPYRHDYLSHYPDIASYYNALDVYVIPARCEGGPMSLLESWAAGVPVVSTRVGMPADFIQQQRNGLICDINDVQGLSHCVERVMEDSSLVQSLKENARRDVMAFSWENVARLYYEKLYAGYL